MTTALTVAGDSGEIGLMELGKILVASGFFKDASQHAQAITKVLLGRELGLTPMAAMIGLHVIDGKPSIGSHVIAAGIKKSGSYDYRVLTKTDKECSIEFFQRPGPGQKMESIGVETFTIEDAKRAGLDQRAPWKRTPKAMLFARAIGQGYRTYCPDALSVLAYAEGELEAPDAIPAEHAPAPDDGKPARPLRARDGGKARPPRCEHALTGNRCTRAAGHDGTHALEYATDPTPVSPPQTSSASAGPTSSPPPTAPGGSAAAGPAPGAGAASEPSRAEPSGASGVTPGSGDAGPSPGSSTPAVTTPASSTPLATAPLPTTGEPVKRKARRD